MIEGTWVRLTDHQTTFKEVRGRWRENRYRKFPSRKEVFLMNQQRRSSGQTDVIIVMWRYGRLREWRRPCIHMFTSIGRTNESWWWSGYIERQDNVWLVEDQDATKWRYQNGLKEMQIYEVYKCWSVCGYASTLIHQCGTPATIFMNSTHPTSR